jgi:hypothetical protein
MRWVSWLWGGLDGRVSRKGGVKHYLVLVLKQLSISGFVLPEALSDRNSRATSALRGIQILNL